MGAVTARDLQTLLFDRETPDTIRSALDELGKLKPTSAKWAAEILATREELLTELRTIESQGRLL
jgi:hypothetical protein